MDRKTCRPKLPPHHGVAQYPVHSVRDSDRIPWRHKERMLPPAAKAQVGGNLCQHTRHPAGHCLEGRQSKPLRLSGATHEQVASLVEMRHGVRGNVAMIFVDDSERLLSLRLGELGGADHPEVAASLAQLPEPL